MIHFIRILSLTLTFGLFNITLLTAGGEEPDTAGKSLFEQFHSDQILDITLKIEKGDILENKKTDNYFPATFSFVDRNDQLQSWDIEVKIRGRFRRMTCDMPPLQLKFPKGELKENGYTKHNDFKLVTHCLDDADGKENVLREYLTYQLHNAITEQSFRTQLVKINYEDPATGSEETSYGFIIEDTDEMKERLQAKSCESCFNLPVDQFEKGELQLNALFQYMIGNTDWSVEAARNLKILQSKATGKFFVVAYDFDFSGLVSPSYARLSNDYQQTSLRDRVLLVKSWESEEKQLAIDRMQAKKEVVLQTVENFKLLSKKSRKDIMTYLEAFYSDLDNGIEVFDPSAKPVLQTK